ncbi:16S rRNA (cytosine(967)-C(5))-methyltransferase RsmB [bacterium]|nr:16S rRNA (cytosine(967)-C(5))-methyltransferase RsmB [bacterium]
MNSKSVRKIALEILLGWGERKSDISRILDRAIRGEQLQDVDKALLTELVYGVLRWRGRLDYIIKIFTHSGQEFDNLTLNILRLGTYQLIITDKIPPYAAINESVNLAEPHRGRKKFINAVLRAIQRNQTEIKYPNKDEKPVQHLSSRYSYPKWMVAKWIKRHGVDWTTAFCEASNQVAPLCVRTNTLRTNRDDLVELLKQEGVEVNHSVIAPEGLRLKKYPNLTKLSAYKRGWFQAQDESSMLTSHILAPQPGEFIMDVCAGPGGKTTHIGQIMQKPTAENQRRRPLAEGVGERSEQFEAERSEHDFVLAQNRGDIVAFDISEFKLSLIKENCQRLGIDIVKPTKFDASFICELFINKADRVLADVPCSNLGVLRRHPDIRWRKTQSQIIALSELQYAILKSASSYLKPNGILVYSTCSIEPEENEQVVMKFLSEHPNFEIESVAPFLPVFDMKCSENLISETGYMQTYPHLHDMDGFFVARMRRKQ